MAHEIERVLYQAEDFLRRNVLRPKTAREAQKRRARRKFEEAMRRVRRAMLMLAGLLAALVVLSLFVDVGIDTWLVGVPTIFLASLLSLLWPTHRRPPAVGERRAAEISLAEMAVRVEEGLMDRSAELPSRALPAADAIVARLGELQPHLGRLDPHSLSAGEARRLICEHLPRLVDAYLELPPSARGPSSESSLRFTEGLNLVAHELDHLLEACCRDRQLSFDTQHRFIETRYREDRRLKGD
jgi:hypothetical protein